MDKNILKGKWTQLRGHAKERWGKLTDDDLDVVDGRADQLTGKLQERYGWTKEKAEEELRDFNDSL